MIWFLKISRLPPLTLLLRGPLPRPACGERVGVRRGLPESNSADGESPVGIFDEPVRAGVGMLRIECPKLTGARALRQ